MGDVKMTNILVSTSHFVATLAFPVKIRTEQAVSKRKTIVQESIDAVIEVTPVIHTATEQPILAELFYNEISEENPSQFTKRKQASLRCFLDKCGAKVRQEIANTIQPNVLEQLIGHADMVIVNFIDKGGRLLKSTKRYITDILSSLSHMESRILFWPKPKKLPSLLIAPAAPVLAKPRRKEKLKGEKEGITKKYLDYNSRRAA